MVKSAAVVRGELTGKKLLVPDEGPGSIFRGGFTVTVDVPESYTWQAANIPNCFIYSPDIPAGCAPVFTDQPNSSQWTTWVGEYPPLYYAAVGWTTLVSTGQVGVYLARFVSAALCAAFLATAFASTSSSNRHRIVALGVVLAATPMTFFLAGGVNPNGLEIASAVCFWTTFGIALSMRGHPVSRGLYLAILISALTLIASRPLSVIWLAVAAVVLLIGFGSPKDLIARTGTVRTAIAATLIGIASIAAVIWTFSLDALGNVQGDEPRGLGLIAALRHSASRTPDYIRQMVGVFGWRSTTPPLVLVIAWGIALLFVVAVALFLSRWRARVAILLAGAAAIGLPIMMEAVQAHDRGFPWQGRYGLPLAVGLPVTASMALSHSRVLDLGFQRFMVVLVVAATAGGQVLAHASSMRRYIVGNGVSWWYLFDHGWEPPLPAWLLLLLAIGGAVALAVLTLSVTLAPPLRSGTEPQQRERRTPHTPLLRDPGED